MAFPHDFARLHRMSILHIDMDAFYAAIEQRDCPDLRNKAIAVGGSASGRGVIQTASYEARKYGVRSAMTGRRAAELCPHLIFVRGRMSHYAAIGKQIREIFHRYTPIVQPLSLDEAFLDVAGSERLCGNAEKIGRAIKNDIRRELELTASVGIAPRKFVAKIASDFGKPNGFLVVAEDNLIEFLDPLPIARLWGVGAVGQRKLKSMGIHKISDIRARPLESMKQAFGNWGEHLWRLANGIDSRRVVVDHEAKQISHERTFSNDITDIELLAAVVSHLSEQVGMRLRRSKRKTKTITLKYRREDFRTFSHSATLNQPTDRTAVIIENATRLLQEMRMREPRPVRLIGVSAGNLTDQNQPQQLTLFEREEIESSRAVDRVVDELSNQIGKNAVYRAASHDWISRGKRSED